MTLKIGIIAIFTSVISASIAAADITISGYGRTGLVYQENNKNSDAEETQISSRMRLDFDASTTTDSGINFGARMRMEWNQGAETEISPANLYASFGDLTVYIGNTDGGFNKAMNRSASELGAFNKSVGGNTLAKHFGFSSGSYRATHDDEDRIGIAVQYKAENLTIWGSYIDPDQSGLREDLRANDIVETDEINHSDNNSYTEEEIGMSISYVWNDKLELAAAGLLNGGGYEGNEVYYIGARYAVMDSAHIGLNYYENGEYYKSGLWGGTHLKPDGTVDENDFGRTITIYGDYTFGDNVTNAEAYIATNDGDWLGKRTDISFGVGVNYDLGGGARLGASLQRDYEEEAYVDLGVVFDF